MTVMPDLPVVIPVNVEPVTEWNPNGNNGSDVQLVGSALCAGNRRFP